MRILMALDLGDRMVTGMSVANRMAVDAVASAYHKIQVINISGMAEGPGQQGFVDYFKRFFTALWIGGKIAWCTLSTDALYVNLGSTRPGLLKTFLLTGVAAALKIRVLMHCHSGGLSSYYDKSCAMERAWIRWVIGRATAIAVVHKEYERFFREFGIPVYVVLNGVEDVGVEMPNRSGRRNRFLFLGNLHESKGYLKLAKTVSDLNQEEEFELKVAGAVPQGRADKAAFKELEQLIDHRIGYEGIVDKAGRKELFQWADFLVLPSSYHNEALPLVILESFSAGRPVIATNYRAMGDVINDQRGMLTAPDLSNLAEVLVAASMLTQDEYSRMAHACRHEWLASYSIDAYRNSLLNVIACALGDNGEFESQPRSTKG